MKPHLVGVRQCAAGIVVCLYHPTLFVLHLHEPAVINVEGEVQPETVRMPWNESEAFFDVCYGMNLRHSLTYTMV